MSKKITCTIICIALVLGSIGPCFAVENSTPSAIKSTKAIDGTKAATDSYVWINGFQFQNNPYYYINSLGNVTSSNYQPSTLGGLFSELTRAIANSAKEIHSKIGSTNTALSTISTYVDGIETLIGTSNTNTGNIAARLTYSSKSAANWLSDIYTYIGNTNTTLAYIRSGTDWIDDIYSILSNLDFGEVIVKDSQGNELTAADFWAKYTNGSVGSFTSYRMSADGTSSSANWSLTNHSAFETIEYILTRFDNSLYQQSAGLIKNWQNYNGDLYRPDLTTYSLGTSGNSLWYDFRRFASNTSQHLARLDFVLASDDEIAARQAAAANQDAAVDNFISSNGAGSASTTDLGDMAAGSSAIKNAFSSNADPTDALGIFSNDDSIWDWFTTDVKNSFEGNSSNTRTLNTTHYYQDYMDQVLRGINENDYR